MPIAYELQFWMSERARKDDRLYERYGRSLESGHVGEFVAISDDGEVILGTDHLALSNEAAARFGEGNFALRKIGAKAEWHLRALAR
ncbi:MAG: hypothetical protein ACRDJW_07830 [Thermomicrobiales bacterium]